MRFKPSRRESLLLLVLFMIGALLGFLGMIQGAWLGATPHFPQERAQLDVEIWGTVTLFCLALATVNAVLLYRGAKNKAQR
jgi:hypothetical protein